MGRCLAVVTAALIASAAGARGDAPPRGHYSAPLPYDGRFTFVRLRWGTDLPSSARRGHVPTAWNRNYPQAEQSLSAIIRDLTYVDVHDEGNEILMLDDPDLFKFPIAVMWEPGFWNLTDREADSFRAYLQKGGFAIFEATDGPAGWANFEAQMRRVLPGGRLVRLDPSHPIFDVFLSVGRALPGYYGVFEDNDPSKRLMLIADSGAGVPDAEAYALGVNSTIYGLTH